MSKTFYFGFSLEFSWLKKWKLRADCDERRKAEERKREENSNSMNWHLSHLTFALVCQLKVSILMWFCNEPWSNISPSACLFLGIHITRFLFSMCGRFGCKSNDLLCRLMGLWRLPGWGRGGGRPRGAAVQRHADYRTSGCGQDRLGVCLLAGAWVQGWNQTGPISLNPY